MLIMCQAELSNVMRNKIRDHRVIVVTVSERVIRKGCPTEMTFKETYTR